MKVLFMVLRIALALGTFCSSGNAGQLVPPPSPSAISHTEPCAGFLLPNTSRPIKEQEMRLGDVFVECRDTVQLTQTSDISSWALELKSKRLLLIRTSAEKLEAELVIANLNPWSETRIRAVSHGSTLVATCGTAMLFDRLPSKYVNAISGVEMKQAPGTEQTRCDDMGGTLARLQKATSVDGGPLMLNGKILARTVANFDVSPNGRFIAFNDEDSLCVCDKEKDAKSCLREFDPVGRMSVWDNGVIVATGETGQACPISPRLLRIPGPPGFCPALFKWRNGSREQMIQFMGTDPQILPASLGSFLLALKH